MRLAIMILFCVCFLLLLEKPLKKYSTVFYIAAVLLAGAGYLAQTRMQPGLAKTILADYLTSGTLPAALFVIVMYAIVLPKKTRIFRCTMSLRGETAILASVLGLTHIAYYGHSLGQRAGRTGGMLSGTDRVTSVIAFMLILLLIPLTVTSFKWVRRKMNGKRWKKLQKWSYLFYGLLYLHVAVVAYPKAVSGNSRSLADLCCYTAVFGIYAVLRIEKYLERKKKQAYYPAVWSLLVIILTTGAFILCFHTAKDIQAEEKIQYISESEIKSDDTVISESEIRNGDIVISESEIKNDDIVLTEGEIRNDDIDISEITITGNDENMLSETTVNNNNEHVSEEKISGYADGIWQGEGMGLNGPVRVEVIVENAMITDVKILERTDDDPYFTDARLELVPEILKKQSADVDVVSGATFSSEGILEAVEEALKLAGSP